MSIIQSDYILKMVAMLGELILAAMKLKKAGSFEQADQTLSDALLSVAPQHADLIDMVDEKTVVTLLGDPRLIDAYVELLLERAELKRILGRDLIAEAIQQRAIRIFLEKFGRTGELTGQGHLLYGRICGF
jgi:hypothetical protein